MMQEHKPVPITQYFIRNLNSYPQSAQEYPRQEFIRVRFLSAYASLDRLEGGCRLLILWRKRAFRHKLEVHHYLLSFGCEGIKEFRTMDISNMGTWGFKKTLNSNYVELNLEEAALLIQDSYAQNSRFQSQPPRGWDVDNPLLQVDTAKIDGTQLLSKLFPGNLNPRMLINVYLDALRRSDRALQYDLRDQSGKAVLGPRDEFINSNPGEMEECVFLRSGIKSMEEKGRSEVQVCAFVIVSTPEEEIIKHTFNLILSCQMGQYYLNQCHPLGKQVLSGQDPENPLDYPVCCSLYGVSDEVRVRTWLEQQPDLILAGEWENGVYFKKIENKKKPCSEFNFSAAVMCEYILTDRELLVYSNQSLNLIALSCFLQEELKGLLKPKDKYYLTVRQLQGAVLNRGKAETLGLSPVAGGTGSIQDVLKQHAGRSAFCKITNSDRKTFIHFMRTEARHNLKLGPQSWYFLLEGRARRPKERGFPLTECYLAANWLSINTFGGDLEEELAAVRSLVPIRTVIYADELKYGSYLSKPQLSAQRIWEIYRGIRNIIKEAEIFRKLGLIPELKELARGMGTLKIGL